MNCGACGELIPADSMFCPECGARQDNSVAGGFAPAPTQNLPPFPPQQRSFDPVSGQAQRMQQENNMNQMGHIPKTCFKAWRKASINIKNLPPGVYPQQPIQGQFPPQQAFPPQGNGMPAFERRPHERPAQYSAWAFHRQWSVAKCKQRRPLSSGGTKIAHNPANSPTDAMVNRLAEAERAVKDERRNQWLSMNQSPASSVLANLGGANFHPT